jgi:hypothetical protein
LRPSEPDTSLAIKLWEGEALTDPQANSWVGNFHVRSDAVRRPVPEGSELQLHIKVDASRLITVEVFVPHLNEHFTDRIFIPKDEEPDYVELLKGAHLEIENCLARLARVEEHLMKVGLSSSSTDDFDFPEVVYDDGYTGGVERTPAPFTPARDPRREEAEALRRELEDFDIELGAHEHGGRRGRPRPSARRRRASTRDARARRRARTARWCSAERLVDGRRRAPRRLGRRRRERARQRRAARTPLGAQARTGGSHGARRRARSPTRGRALRELRGQVLHAQQWFWESWFTHMRRPGTRFVNNEEAARWLAEGEEALQASDRQKLERAVRWLWSLLPPRRADRARRARREAGTEAVGRAARSQTRVRLGTINAVGTP